MLNDLISTSKPPKGTITLKFEKIPKECGECPCYIYEFDEDAFFGDNMVGNCIFGCSIWGCRVKRPDDCPIEVL